MNEEALNMSLRKFLKVVGVTSQQEIEKAIRAAVARVAVAAVGVPEPPEQRLPVGALVHPAVRVVELQLLPANRSRGLRTT